MSGVDIRFASGWRVGVTGGYRQTDIKGKNRSGSATSDNWHLGIYGGNQWGPLGLRAGLIHTWSSIDASRSVSYPGLDERLKADYDARTLQVFGEVGVPPRRRNSCNRTICKLIAIRLRTDSFTETGGISGLSVDSDSTNTTFTTLGLRASAPVDLGSMTARIKGMVGWRHAFNDVTPTSTQAFIGSNSFTVGGVPIAKNTAMLEAGIDFAVSPAANLGLSYVGQYGSHAVQNGFNANLSVNF